MTQKQPQPESAPASERRTWSPPTLRDLPLSATLTGLTTGTEGLDNLTGGLAAGS